MRIKKYEDKFRELKSGFQEHSVLATQITILQTKFLVQHVLDSVNNMGKSQIKILIFL